MPKPVLRISKLVKIGNSSGVTLPAAFLRALGVVRGDYLRMILDGSVISIRGNDEKRLPLSAGQSSRGVGKFLEE